jgi:hypothetical protein
LKNILFISKKKNKKRIKNEIKNREDKRKNGIIAMMRPYKASFYIKVNFIDYKFFIILFLF